MPDGVGGVVGGRVGVGTGGGGAGWGGGSRAVVSQLVEEVRKLSGIVCLASH